MSRDICSPVRTACWPQARRCAGAMRVALTLVGGLAVNLQAQANAEVRPLGQIEATSGAFGTVVGVRHLPGNTLLVNDVLRRQVVLLDSALAPVKIVADTTAATRRAYGNRIGGLLAYRGDSTLFIDPGSLSMLVIDPDGSIVRTMAAPRADDLAAVLGGPRGNAGFDKDGRLVYRPAQAIAGFGTLPTTAGVHVVAPDSAPIVRFDLTTRTLDTIAYTRIEPHKVVVARTDSGTSVSPILDPLPDLDEWTIDAAGNVVVLRHDMHIDFVDARGNRRGPRIPFAWRRLTDSAKVAIVDSLRKVNQPTTQQEVRPAGLVPLGVGPAQGGGAAGGPPQVGPVPLGGPAGGRRVLPGHVTLVPPEKLPDYWPAFDRGALRADPSGKLWIRVLTGREREGVAQYAVLNAEGELVDTVLLPRGTVIVGFGEGGMVYLAVRDAAGVRIVRARER